MGGWLESLVPWGTDAIIWVQSVSPGWMDPIFAFLTWLGYEEFYLFVLPVVYWCIHKEIGVGLAYISMLSTWVNSVVKHACKIPRPSGVAMRAPRPETTPSFPSNHAQSPVAVWGYLASRFRRGWLWALTVVLALGVGLSRIVLGVHFPQDVIGGWIIGAIVLLLYVWLEPPVGRWVGRQAIPVQLGLAAAIPLALIFVHPPGADGQYPVEEAVTTMSALSGLGVGVVMERAWLRFRVEGALWRRGLRFVAGLVVVGVLYSVPRLLLPEEMAYALEVVVRFVRYALIGWVVGFLAPWLFVRLGLAERGA